MADTAEQKVGANVGGRPDTREDHDPELVALLAAANGPNAVSLVMQALSAYVPDREALVLVLDPPGEDGQTQMHLQSTIPLEVRVLVMRVYLSEWEHDLAARSLPPASAPATEGALS